MARAFEGWVREAEGWEVMAPVHLAHTVLNGRMALRLSVGNVETTPQHVARTWELLQAAARSEGADA